MPIDNGPATSNASLWLGAPPTASIEVHVGNPPSALTAGSGTGINPQPPSDTVIPVPPEIATTVQTQTRLTMFLGQTASIKFVNPA